MNAEKIALKRNNKIFFFIGNFAAAMLYMGYLKEYLVQGNTLTKTIVVLIPLMLIHSVIIVTKFKDKTEEKLKWVGTIGFLLMNCIGLICSKSNIVFITGIAILLVAAIYLDGKLIKCANTMIIVMNAIDLFIRIVIKGQIQAEYSTTYMSTLGAIIVFTYGYSKLVENINMMREENEQKVREEINKQNTLLQDIFKVIGILEENTSKVNDVVEAFSESSGTVNEVINQIAMGADDVTKSIQNQTEMTEVIGNLIEETAEEFMEIKRISEVSQDNLKDGSVMMNQVSEKTLRASEQNSCTYEIMKELKEKSKQVFGITEMITGISNQTNLLSLNAAIESARAGEAGRGFSVVAEEIRKLSTQTQELTASISAIILELEQKVDQAEEAVKELNEISSEQNKLVDSTKEIFEQMIVNMEASHQKVDGMSSKVNQIVISNNNIVAGINDISAVSEETSASSEEASSIALNNLENANVAKGYVKELVSVSEDLKKYI